METRLPGRHLLPDRASLERQPQPVQRACSSRMQPFTRHEAFDAACHNPSIAVHITGRWTAREFMGSGHPYVPSRAEYKSVGLITDPADEGWHERDAAIAEPPLLTAKAQKERDDCQASIERLHPWHAWSTVPTRPSLPPGINDYVRQKIPAECQPTDTDRLEAGQQRAVEALNRGSESDESECRGEHGGSRVGSTESSGKSRGT